MSHFIAFLYPIRLARFGKQSFGNGECSIIVRACSTHEPSGSTVVRAEKLKKAPDLCVSHGFIYVASYRPFSGDHFDKSSSFNAAIICSTTSLCFYYSGCFRNPEQRLAPSTRPFPGMPLFGFDARNMCIPCTRPMSQIQCLQGLNLAKPRTRGIRGKLVTIAVNITTVQRWIRRMFRVATIAMTIAIAASTSMMRILGSLQKIKEHSKETVKSQLQCTTCCLSGSASFVLEPATSKIAA
jgi:hypothetical protein